MSCHSIVHVASTMGNGDFTSRVSAAASSSRPATIRYLHAAGRFPDLPQSGAAPAHVPEAVHAGRVARVLLGVPQGAPGHAGESTTAGCAASTSTTTGRPAAFRARARARSTIRPSHPTCADCHMPLVRFARPRQSAMARCIRTASPRPTPPSRTSTRTTAQLRATEKFLQSGFITVDIFAAVAGGGRRRAQLRDAPPRRRYAARRTPPSRWAKRPNRSGPVMIREVGKIAAPHRCRRACASSPAPPSRVDVVVRTRKIGHFFPGGTVDAFDVWLEFQGARCATAA